jgi:hypothetical protein
VSLSAPIQAAGLVVGTSTGTSTGAGGGVTAIATVLGIPTARTAEAGDVTVNGRMQYGVTWPHWKFAGTIGAFGVFQNSDPRGWAWASGGAGDVASGTTVTASAPPADGTQRIVVHAASATTLVRSVAWSPGWRATLAPEGPQANVTNSTVPVTQRGILQAVPIPKPGAYVVTFTYAPTSSTVGLALSGGAVVVAVAWAAFEAVATSRRRRGRADRRARAPGLSPN